MGGGGGSSSKLAQQQDQMEQERLAAIKSGISGVNSAYDNPARQGQYDEFLGANRKQFFDELNKQQGDALRQNKFALARSGLVGSRQQVDRGTDLGDAYQKGVINAERQAQGNLVGLKNADEDSRRSLIQQVQNGADVTTASSAAMRTLQNNLAGAKASEGVGALGNVFGGFSDLYKRSRDREDEKRAMNDLRVRYSTSNQWGFQPNGGGN